MTTRANNRTNKRASRSSYPWKTRRTYPIAGEPSEAEARGIVASMRRGFFADLAQLLLRSSPIRQVALDDKSQVLFWPGPGERFDYAMLEPYIQPANGDPARPLILRVSINFGASDVEDRITNQTSWKAIVHNITQSGTSNPWSMELSLLHHQILDFAPWVESLIRAHDTEDESLVIESPHPLWFRSQRILDCNYIWSASAYDRIKEYDEVCPARLRPYLHNGTINKIDWRSICPELIPKNSNRSSFEKEHLSKWEVN